MYGRGEGHKEGKIEGGGVAFVCGVGFGSPLGNGFKLGGVYFPYL